MIGHEKSFTLKYNNTHLKSRVTLPLRMLSNDHS